jgi:hypothetical protein
MPHILWRYLGRRLVSESLRKPDVVRQLVLAVVGMSFHGSLARKCSP